MPSAQGDPLPAPKGMTGLHDGTFAGDVALLNSQGAQAGQQSQIRLAVYPASGQYAQTGFCLVLDGATSASSPAVAAKQC